MESHCITDCNITVNICVTTYQYLCVVNLLFVALNGPSRNGPFGPIEPKLHQVLHCVNNDKNTNAENGSRFILCICVTKTQC